VFFLHYFLKILTKNHVFLKPVILKISLKKSQKTFVAQGKSVVITRYTFLCTPNVFFEDMWAKMTYKSLFYIVFFIKN
jgi:hypothetical protein